ncbi:DUF3089 domain-containing protein [Sphingomicrobium flavum]|uniref:DUF3089 domain-containing protein n=1 Tax=Sphingomicrobium flavum TaxID=1229164 RepID=UPI0021ADDB34|nr:DUF3089 domain-containing protein [Sphingomicrobium flavum]
MRVMLAAIAASLGLAAQPAAAQPSAPDYASPANWLCLPGRNDICSMPLSVTPLGPKGYGPQIVSAAAKAPAVDCFYVYPTVSRDSGLNSDLTPSSSEEKFVAQYQFSRLSSVCRPFAPMYRQMTMAAIAVATTGGDVSQPGIIAYSDVAAAWKDYLANRNDGRPFVLIGHSQGSIMLEQLIANEIEGTPAHKRMLRAILPGWNIRVPEGKTVGGSFKQTPLCTRPSQTGCVMSWVTFEAGKPPQSNALFGVSNVPGQTVACVNPANPGSMGWEKLDSFWFARSSYPVPGGPVRWSSTGAPPTAYITTPDLMEGRCVNDGPRGYLEVRSAKGPGDVRTDRVGGEVGQFGIFLTGWGKHLADISIAQNDLIASVDALGSRTPQSNISSNE